MHCTLYRYCLLFKSQSQSLINFTSLHYIILWDFNEMKLETENSLFWQSDIKLGVSLILHETRWEIWLHPAHINHLKIIVLFALSLYDMIFFLDNMGNFLKFSCLQACGIFILCAFEKEINSCTYLPKV